MKLIMVRHGDYDIYEPDEPLTEVGEIEAGIISEKLLAVVGGQPIALVVSPVRRARETADILATKLNVVTRYESGVFATDADDVSCPDIAACVEVIDSLGLELPVIVVSHDGPVSAVPRFLIRRAGLELVVSRPEKGEANILDLEAGITERVKVSGQEVVARWCSARPEYSPKDAEEMLIEFCSYRKRF